MTKALVAREKEVEVNEVKEEVEADFQTDPAAAFGTRNPTKDSLKKA
jgi:hypothetical protein